MLSSLITLIQALCQTLARRLGRRFAAPPSSSSAPAGSPGSRCEDPLCGVLELKFRRAMPKVFDTQSVWIRVDTDKLIARLLENPDINLDALQGVASHAPAGKTKETARGDWHGKVRQITQAPPAPAVRTGQRRPPPPTWH